MTGVWVIGVLIVVGVGALIFFRQKWARADKKQARGRTDKIEEERIEAVARRETREGAEKTEGESGKE